MLADILGITAYIFHRELTDKTAQTAKLQAEIDRLQQDLRKYRLEYESLKK